MTAALCANAWPATECAPVQAAASAQLLLQRAVPLGIGIVLALLAKRVDSRPGAQAFTLALIHQGALRPGAITSAPQSKSNGADAHPRRTCPPEY